MVVVVLKGVSDMTKIVSISMAIIIMLNAGLATPPINDSSMTTITASAKTKPSPQKKKAKPKKKKKHIHNMPKGNMVRLRPLAVRDEGSNKNCRTVKVLRLPSRAAAKILGTVGREFATARSARLRELTYCPSQSRVT